MRCVIYLRVSTREQAEKGEGEEGFSIPAQREACTRHIRDAGWQLTDEYVDRGESARSADRPALKAMLARIAEDRYVTGDWTLQRLAGELAHQGLTNRGQRGKPAAPITWQGLAKILANPVYIGVVEWNGVRYPGTHDPLVTPEVFRRVQELLAARAARGTRERKHPHYLKGLLHCGVCGRRLSIQHSKGRYTYFFCLGQKNDPLGTCREPYVAADDVEAQVEDLYRRIQLPDSWAERLREEMAAEIEERQTSDTAQRELLTSQLAKAENEWRKLLDAYYGGAIDVPTLKTEQARIGSAIEAAKDRLADLDANLGEQQEILDLAASLATRCGNAYLKANDRTRKLFNADVFEHLDVKGGQLCHEQYRPPFDGVFNVSEFEYGTRVSGGGASKSQPRPTIAGQPIYLGERKPVASTCRDEVVATVEALVAGGGGQTFSVEMVHAAMVSCGSRWSRETVTKTMLRMTLPARRVPLLRLERAGANRYRYVDPT